MALVTAYDNEAEQKVTVPEHWIGHKTLGQHLTKTPRRTPAADSKKTDKTPAAGDTTKGA